MKIVKKEASDTPFRDLVGGDVFSYKNKTYLKVLDLDSRSSRVICFEDSTMGGFNLSTCVVKLEATLTVSEV